MGTIAVALGSRVAHSRQSYMKLDSNPSILVQSSGLPNLSHIFHLLSNFCFIVQIKYSERQKTNLIIFACSPLGLDISLLFCRSAKESW